MIACVGKPSAGKSSFLNAVTSANAKVGNFPFTTIEPNQGVAYYPIECPCKRYNRSDQCRPRYGSCKDGKRLVPVRMLDVAGLVPGASEGRGLGNQFLDDLRHAQVLIHVVDSSGSTDENGKETKNYDPINDIEWLRSEIHSWIFSNLLKKWPGILRRQMVAKAAPITVFQEIMSGYGANRRVIVRTLNRMDGLRIDVSNEEAGELEIPGYTRPPGKDTATVAQSSSKGLSFVNWTKKHLHVFVSVFLDERFPTVIALNKIDRPEADRNIARILRKYGTQVSGQQPLDGIRPENIVLTSALSECFLKKMEQQGFVRYSPGDDDFLTNDDDPALKPLDDRIKDRLEDVRDLVLFRYGSTGTQEAIVRAVEALGMIPVFPVLSISNFGGSHGGGDKIAGAPSESGASGTGGGAFVDCVLVRRGTTVREFAKIIGGNIDRYYAGAETVGNIQLGENEPIVLGKNNIISFKTTLAK